MQFHEPPMMNNTMNNISLLQHKGGNCLDIGLSLATDCPQTHKTASSIIPTRYDRGYSDDIEVDKVVKQEDSARSTMKRSTAVSFLDWGNRDEFRVSELKNGENDRDLDRMCSGVSTLSGCGGGGDSEKQSQCVQQSGKREEEGQKKLSREHMFDKAVTPSDVGKLNRLVIPKQHAEKFFPLDTTANEKGLLLNFEDNTGKAWRFRYSYWNSSQSYVLTKGWSRFVKEKKLYAGDIVSFERETEQNNHRLFISWRRRPVQQPSFVDPSKAVFLPGYRQSPHIQYRPFHPHPHGLNISAATTAVGRQPQLQNPKVFPQWMSLVWPANGGGASSRAASISIGSEVCAPWRPQPQQMDPYFHTQSSDLIEMKRVPHDFMQLNAPQRSPGDVLWPVETKPGTGFDPPTSKKGVRLFGVNL